MVDTVTGIGQSQAEIADAINRKYVGYSQKQKNQMMAAGSQDPGSFAMQYQPQIQQAQQPSQFQGANVLNEISSANNRQNSDIILGLQGQYGLSNLEWNKTNNTTDPNTGEVSDSLSLNSPFGPEGTTKNLVLDSLRGSSTYKPEKLATGLYQSNEVFPNNPMKDKLTGLFDPIYGNDYNKQLMQTAGSRLGISNEDIGKLAGIVSGSRYNRSLTDHKAPWAMGGKDTTDPYINILNQFYAAKTGSALPTQTNTGLQTQAQNIDDYLRDLRKVQETDVPWYVPGAIGNELFGDSFHQDVGKVVDLAFNVMGMPTFGGSQRVGAATDTLGTTGSFDKSFDTATSDGWEGAGKAIAAQGLADTLAGDWSGTGTSLGLTSDAATSAAIGQAAKGALQGAGTAAIGGGGWGDVGTGAVSGGLSSGLSNYLSASTKNLLGEVGSKALGGAASGGVNSLFTKNSPISGSLYGGMSGGLYGLLNSTDRNNNTYNQQSDTKNRQTANTLVNLIKMLSKKK